MLNAKVTGSTVTQVRDDIYLVNVVARAVEEERASFGSLASLQVPTPSGRMVPLSQFATVVEEQEFPLVWRRNRLPTLTVRADVDHSVLPDTVVGALAPKIAELNARLPSQYKIETGGMYEESAISSASVFAVVPLMIVLMLTTMMVMLGSFRRLAMVVAVLPLGLIGVVLSLLLFNRPLGFVAILGVLALIGMIAKNTVILIVQIETDRAEGKNVLEAVLASATSRLRPMVLTAISTVLGLLPIAPTVFWGPMAFAIMGGLLVATLLTLIFLPALYVTVFGGKPPAPETAGSRVSFALRTALVRGILFLVFWVALIGFSLSALAVGIVAAAGATWVEPLPAAARAAAGAPRRARCVAAALSLAVAARRLGCRAPCLRSAPAVASRFCRLSQRPCAWPSAQYLRHHLQPDAGHLAVRRKRGRDHFPLPRCRATRSGATGGGREGAGPRAR